jgi:hypothetical protein
MNTWLTSMCQGSATEDAMTFGITCVVLAVLLLIGIALGFWPLRAWLGMDARRGRLARRSPGEASSLLATWRLFRRLRSGGHFRVPDVPSVMVPERVAEDTQDKRPTSGPITTMTG